MDHWPMYYLVLYSVFFGNSKYSVYTLNVKVEDEEENVGTTLFDKNILNNHCWTNEEFIILNSRKIFQNLIPKMVSSSGQTDEYIAELLNYFHTCLEYVSNMSVGKTKHLFLKSLADAMGGYLYSYAVPITKISFYAGDIKFCNIKKMFKLLEELKSFLHTDGTGWRKTLDIEMFVNATPIVISIENTPDSCAKLIINHSKNLSENTIDHSNGFTYLFLPYLDNDEDPNSIALPFRDRSLWSLYTEESVAVLTQYYKTCVNCISTSDNYQKTLTHFNRDFYKWLLRSVYPRLNDDKWYPAFGGVLRIIAFLKDSVEKEGKEGENNETQVDITVGNVSHSPIKVILSTTTKSIEVANERNTLGTTELIVIAISSAALIWILVGLSLVCYKYLRKHSDQCSPCESPRSDFVMFYKNNDFHDIDTCTSVNSNKSVSQKIKDWWRQRFKTCPGGCDRNLEKEKCLATFSYRTNDFCTNAKRKSHKKKKKKFKSISVLESPDSSPCAYLLNQKYHYNSDISSSNSESSFR